MSEQVQSKPEAVDLRGHSFGRWTVLDAYQTTPRGERKWFCRCTCGTRRYVLERSLKSGGSLSCGCLRREQVGKAIAYDFTGQRFGELTVLEKDKECHKNGGVWWLCKCSCGKEYAAPATLLATGKRTHCGCRTKKKQTICDITGQTFSRLTALYPTRERDAKGSVIWHCRCTCGNEIDVSYNNLKYCEMKSCACQKKEHDQMLRSFLTHVDGTSIEMIKSRKIPVNNTTGVKGVYLIRGKYAAKIVFQKKQYFLGTYTSLEEAAAARKAAEEHLRDVILPHYESWKVRADRDSVWASENPIRILVERNGARDLQVYCLPELTESVKE